MRGIAIVSLVLLVTELCFCTSMYSREELAKEYPGFGTEWIFVPGPDETPVNISLVSYESYASFARHRLDLLQLAQEIRFLLYTREEPKSTKIAVNKESLKNSTFDPNKETKIITHGYLSNGDSDTCTSIKNAYLNTTDANVIIIDWAKYSSGWYFTIASDALEIGNYSANLINFLVENGADPKKIHMIGHSLGAHLSGQAGMIAGQSGNKIGRITGLDPASISFFTVSPDRRLSPDDADFVDVIHTSGMALGLYTEVGDVDFYPNGGTPIQPGCGSLIQIIESCSHGRSWKFFAESVTREKPFMSYKCQSWSDFKHGRNCTDPVEMGDPTPSTTRGDYYLATNNEAPFAMGEDSRF